MSVDKLKSGGDPLKALVGSLADMHGIEGEDLLGFVTAILADLAADRLEGGRGDVEIAVSNAVREAIAGVFDLGTLKKEIVSRRAEAIMPEHTILLPSRTEDWKFKVAVFEMISTDIGIESNFESQMRPIVDRAVKLGISYMDLVSLFLDHKVLGFMLYGALALSDEGVVDDKEFLYLVRLFDRDRIGIDVASRVRAVRDFAFKDDVDRDDDMPQDEDEDGYPEDLFDGDFDEVFSCDLEEDMEPDDSDIGRVCREYFEDFSRRYDFTSGVVTIARFIKLLLKAVPEDNVGDAKDWLKENMWLLYNLLVKRRRKAVKEEGKVVEMIDIPNTSHLERLIGSLYSGNVVKYKGEERYMRLNVSRFLYIGKTGTPILNIDVLRQFFYEDVVALVERADFTIAGARSLLITEAQTVLAEMHENSVGQISVIEDGRATLSSSRDLPERLRDLIIKYTPKPDEGLNMKKMFNNMGELPEVFETQFRGYFPEGEWISRKDRSLKDSNDPYYLMMRREFEIFKIVDEEAKDHSHAEMDVIDREVKRILRDIDKELIKSIKSVGVESRLKVPMEVLHHRDDGESGPDYSRLLWLAKKGVDGVEEEHNRYVKIFARIKLQLLWLYKRGKQSVFYGLRDALGEDVRRSWVAPKFKRLKIETNNEEPIYVDKYFVDTKDDVREVGQEHAGEENVRHIRLVKAKLYGVDGYVLVPGVIDFKDWYSMMIKVIRSDNEGPEDQNDIFRWTFICEDMNNLKVVAERSVEDVCPGGTSKIEDRYGLLDRGSLGVGANDAKAKDYRTFSITGLRQVNFDGRLLDVKQEQRLLLLEDYLKTISSRHKVGHGKYKYRREAEVLMAMFPFDIFPNLYGLVQPEEGLSFEDKHKAGEGVSTPRTLFPQLEYRLRGVNDDAPTIKMVREDLS